MYDDTGHGWLWHMLSGTSKILQLLGPERCRTGASREFFLEVRIFEIARAILFSERSFLSQNPWTDLMKDIWAEDYINDWSPRERLLDIMTLVSDLCVR
jgi:hypothetical protein